MKFSKLMLGTVQFGLDYGVANAAGKPSYENACDIIAAAYEGGVNCLDTAAAYGNSEEVLGRALAELDLADKMTVISKVPPLNGKTGDEARGFIECSITGSLEKLRLEKLPVCLFHKEEDIEQIPLLREFVEQGMIGAAGISLDSGKYAERVFELNIKYIQIPFNMLDKRLEKSDFFNRADAEGVAVFSRSAFLQGLLLMPEEAIISELSEVIPVRRKLEAAAQQHGLKMTELCMRYVISKTGITSVLFGVDNLSQLHENLAIAHDGALSAEFVNRIEEIVPELPELIVRPALWERNR